MTLPVAGVISAGPPDGLVDLTEGAILFQQISGAGFAYGEVLVRVTALTYSQFAAQGFDLLNFFDVDDIPDAAADSML